MLPGTYNLELYRGDTYTWKFVLWKDANRTQPVDLTGAVVAAEIRDRPGGAKIIPMSTAITLPNTAQVQLTATQWTKKPPPNAYWDVQVTFPNTAVQTIVKGSVKITTDVTAST